MRRTALAVGVLFLSATACNFDSAKSSSGTASSTISSDPSRPDQSEALMQTSRDWAKIVASGDVEGILSYWTDDAILLQPDQRALIGKAAIRQMVEESMKNPRFSITWGPESAVISKGGDMGYLVEHNSITFADPTGKMRTRFGKSVTIWRKDASGAWKCVVDTWNSSPTENVFPEV